jgi:hypothetical protein
MRISKDSATELYERALAEELAFLRSAKNFEKTEKAIDRIAKLLTERITEINEELRSILLMEFNHKYNNLPRATSEELLEIYIEILLRMAKLIPKPTEPFCTDPDGDGPWGGRAA